MNKIREFLQSEVFCKVKDLAPKMMSVADRQEYGQKFFEAVEHSLPGFNTYRSLGQTMMFAALLDHARDLGADRVSLNDLAGGNLDGCDFPESRCVFKPHENQEYDLIKSYQLNDFQVGLDFYSSHFSLIFEQKGKKLGIIDFNIFEDKSIDEQQDLSYVDDPGEFIGKLKEDLIILQKACDLAIGRDQVNLLGIHNWINFKTSKREGEPDLDESLDRTVYRPGYFMCYRGFNRGEIDCYENDGAFKGTIHNTGIEDWKKVLKGADPIREHWENGSSRLCNFGGWESGQNIDGELFKERIPMPLTEIPALYNEAQKNLDFYLLDFCRKIYDYETIGTKILEEFSSIAEDRRLVFDRPNCDENLNPLPTDYEDEVEITRPGEIQIEDWKIIGQDFFDYLSKITERFSEDQIKAVADEACKGFKRLCNKYGFDGDLSQKERENLLGNIEYILNKYGMVTKAQEQQKGLSR